jgi:glycosyltransferase involved in cell wall biosynthesis
MLAPGMVLKPVLLTEFGGSSPPFDSLAGTLLHRLMTGRRSGFRTVVSNRAAVVMAGSDCALQPALVSDMPSTDAASLNRFENDRARSWTEFRGESSALFELLTCRHLRAQRGARPSLLLDMRNLGSGFNGTSFAALGAATGLHRAGIAWDVAILANERGAEFHDLERQFPGWPVYTSEPPPGFNVALRLSQPWHIDEMIDLHRAARLNAYLMLDTIAWDAVYVAPPYLDGTWQFLAATADSLLFISDFSRRRFRARFPHDQPMADTVCHLSFAPGDYTRPELLDCADADYLLVMGNHLEHKDVSATAELLGSAFPLLRIETFGPAPWRSPTMVSHHSGRLPDIDVQRLYAAARLALFPSFYEGFGIPVVTALAYGRTLLARESGWLDEVAERCSPRGRLITYRRRDDLVRQVERLLNGESVASRPLGTAVTSGRPRSWQDVGLQIEHSLRTLMTAASPATWRAREHLVSQAVACRRS